MMDDRAETRRIEERLPQGTDEWLARPRLSTTSRGTITPVVILQPLSAPVGDVVMYTGPLQPIGWQLHGIGREFGGGTQPADVAVEAGAITQDKRRVDVGPTRASKSRRMDRRLTHWQCIYCRDAAFLVGGATLWLSAGTGVRRPRPTGSRAETRKLGHHKGGAGGRWRGGCTRGPAPDADTPDELKPVHCHASLIARS